MKTLFLLSVFFQSALASATKEWPQPESKNCNSIAECHGKGDSAIRKGWIDFLGKGRGNVETFEIRAPSVVLIGHSATYWDTKAVTRQSVRQLMADLKDRHLPIVYLSLNYKIDRQKEFLTSGDFDFVGMSIGGNHALQLPETETVLVSGGYYHQCLCNSLADVINSLKPGKEMTIVMPMETVYMSEAKSEVQEIFPLIAEFDAPTSIRELRNVSPTAEDFKHRLAKSVSDLLFKPTSQLTGDSTTGRPQSTICPYQPAFNNVVDPATLSIEVYTHDSNEKESKEKIASFGSGTRKLQLVFASLDVATQYLVDQVGPIEAQSVHYDWGGGEGPSGEEEDREKVTRIERTVHSRRFATPVRESFSPSPIHNETGSGAE